MYFLKNKIRFTTFPFSGSEICLGYENRMLISKKCLVSQNTTSIVCIFISFKPTTCFGPHSWVITGHKRKLRKVSNVSHKISYINLKFNKISLSFFLLTVIIASFKIVKTQTV